MQNGKMPKECHPFQHFQLFRIPECDPQHCRQYAQPERKLYPVSSISLFYHLRQFFHRSSFAPILSDLPNRFRCTVPHQKL